MKNLEILGLLIASIGLLGFGSGAIQSDATEVPKDPSGEISFKSQYSCSAYVEASESCFLINPHSKEAGEINEPRRLLVLVHGIIGGGASTWEMWDNLAWEAHEFDHFDIYRINYFTPLFEKAPNIYETAINELQKLRDRGGFKNYKSTHIVAHSMGGLVVKGMLLKIAGEAYSQKELDKIKTVVFLGTPAQGADLASLAYLFTKNIQVRDLWPAHLNSYLQSLEDQWKRFLRRRRGVNSPFPQVYCAYEDKPIKVGWWPFRVDFLVVPRQMSSSTCDDDLHPMPFDHYGLAKATESGKEPFAWVRERIVDTDRKSESLEKARGAIESAKRAAMQGDSSTGRNFLSKAKGHFEQASDEGGIQYIKIQNAILDEHEGQDEAAREKYAGASYYFTLIKDHQRKAEALLGLGHLEAMALNHRKAVAALTESYNLFELSDDMRGKANAALVLGQLALRQDDKDGARKRFDEARSLFEGLTDKDGIARAKMWLGDIDRIMGQDDEALKKYEISLKTFEEFGDIQMQLEVLYRTADSEMHLAKIHNRQPTEARKLLKQSRDLLAKGSFPAQEAPILFSEAHLKMIDENAEAESDLKKALRILETRVKDPLKEAKTLYMLGLLACNKDGDIASARQTFGQVHQICMSAKCPNENIAASIMLSNLYQTDAGSIERAREYLYRAATLEEEFGRKENVKDYIAEARKLVVRQDVCVKR